MLLILARLLGKEMAQRLAEEMGARLVAIDTITAFEAAVAGQARYRSYLWAISDCFKRQGVTIILTAEASSPFVPQEVSAAGVSFIADNVIFLRYLNLGGERRRGLGVLKMRGSRHDPCLREFVIAPGRIAVGDRVDGAVAAS